MRSRAAGIVAALCLVAILAAAIAPTAGDPAHGIIPSVVALADAPALVRCPPAGIDGAPRGAPRANRPPVRAPPVS